MATERRARGTGTIEKMPDGRFRARLPGAGPRLDAAHPSCVSEAAALAILADLAAELLAFIVSTHGAAPSLGA